MHQHSADCHHIPLEPQATGSPASESQTKQTQLTIALLLIGSFAVAELVVGLTSGSLALIAEAGHMTADSLALVLALVATRLTLRPKGSVLSDLLTGMVAEASPISSQAAWETWAALVNGLGLVAIAFWIGWEAAQRLYTPPEAIASLPMLITAAIGLVVNSVNIALLHRGSSHDLNLRGAFLHVLADAMSCIGVILAAIAVATLQWLWADGVISLVVASLILIGAMPLVVRSVRALRGG
ncbi:cation diffusion facilitator family transporter [Stenomitos frigidus]|uniref:Cation transporter n=1 Tax=Stenomitos frigidus ULC18 TaxID=2107698 RepID=A0A2T1ECZ3_9CYAN|nr:cation diffusion facilitator family transporter [Stenomitos frigidus]PSB30584.1 cation transporter [Stenomitos frigidus ULC18]